jgi:hypothetical protein
VLGVPTNSNGNNLSETGSVNGGGSLGSGTTTYSVADSKQQPVEKRRFFADKRDYRSFEMRKIHMQEAANSHVKSTLDEFKAISSSEHIMRRAEIRTIDTVFCLFVDFIRAAHGESEAGDYIAAQSDNEAWKEKALDLEDIRAELLIPELGALLKGLRFELIRGDNDVELEYNESTSMVVSHSLFGYLVRQHAVRSRVASKYYTLLESRLQEQRQVNDLICQGVPFELLEDAIKNDRSFRLETEEEREERERSFKPRITKKAAHLNINSSSNSRDGSGKEKGGTVSERLYRQSEITKRHLDEARARIAQAESAQCTFKPRFYKPPAELSTVGKRIDVKDPHEYPAPPKHVQQPKSATEGNSIKQAHVILKRPHHHQQQQQQQQCEKDGASATSSGDESKESVAQEGEGEEEGEVSVVIASPPPPPPSSVSVYQTSLVQGRVVAPPLPVEMTARTAAKHQQSQVARQLAKELFDSSPRDPLKPPVAH